MRLLLPRRGHLRSDAANKAPLLTSVDQKDRLSYYEKSGNGDDVPPFEKRDKRMGICAKNSTSVSSKHCQHRPARRWSVPINPKRRNNQTPPSSSARTPTSSSMRTRRASRLHLHLLPHLLLMNGMDRMARPAPPPRRLQLIRRYQLKKSPPPKVGLVLPILQTQTSE